MGDTRRVGETFRMKKHWLAVIGENELSIATIAVGKSKEIEIHMHASYKEPGGKNIGYAVPAGYDVSGLKNWLQYQRIPLHKLKIAVSGQGLITTIITLPNMADQELEKFIAGDMDEYLERYTDHYIVDYRILKKYQENGVPMLKVLLAAFPAEKMKQVQSFCRDLGIEPKTVDLTADCLARIYSFLAERMPAHAPQGNTEQGQNSNDFAIVSLNPGLIEFVLLENGSFFLYTDLKVNTDEKTVNAEETLNADERNQNASRTGNTEKHASPEDLPQSTGQEPSDLLDELIGLETKDSDYPQLDFYRVQNLRNHQETLSLEELEAAEFYYSQLESVKSVKEKDEFVLEDLFVPYELLEEELPISSTYQDLEKEMAAKADKKADLSMYSSPKELSDISGKLDLSPIISALSKLLNFYSDRHAGNSVGTIYLTGEYSLWPGLEEYFRKSLRINTETGFPNNWMPLFKADGDTSLAENWQKYGSLYGLALREDIH